MSDGVQGCATDRPRGLTWTRLVLLLLLVGLLVTATGIAMAAAGERVTWQPIVLLYHSDVGGKVEPCG